MPKKKKLNDKYLKPEKYESEESNEIKRFIFILLGIIVIVLIIYGVSKIFVKEDNSSTRVTTTGEINYDIVTVGTMFNKVDKEYYVMIYDEENPEAVLYSTIINEYLSTSDSLNVYFCNLGNKLNSSYYVGSDKTSNPKATAIDDLALGDLTLVRIKNGKIVKYVEELDSIKKEFGL